LVYNKQTNLGVYMKKGTIIAVIVGIIILVGVIGIVLYTNRPNSTQNSGTGANRVCNVHGNVYTASDNTNPAAAVDANETRLTCDDFAQYVDKSQGIEVVEMYLPTCPHCQKMGPIITQIADELHNKYKFYKIDVSKYPEIGTEFNIDSVPAFIFFKNGKEVTRLIGEQPKQTIIDKLNSIK
jgi:thioredoxin 1